MAGAPSSYLCFLSLLLSLLIPSSPTTITLPLSHFKTDPSPHPYQKLTYLASVSLARAHHIKNPKKALATATTTTPLSSHSYGGYSVSLSFGTPPQTIPFVFDTGSGFVWFPCTHRYVCRNCTSSPTDPPVIQSFIPKLSSSAKILGCLSPKCGLIHNNPDVHSRCKDCQAAAKDCKQICPPYLILYGSGSTGGVTLVETLDLPGQKVPNFVVGCSLFSSHQPAGIAGFGRGPSSLPTQLGLKRFSYCLLSPNFDDTSTTTQLVLDTGSDSTHKTPNLTYTPLIKNPLIPTKHQFSVYYYVNLKKITVGGEKIKIPSSYLSPGKDGNGGTIVDSGTTFTYMAYNVFEPLMTSFINQVKDYKRVESVESQTGLRPCFNVSGHKTVSLPEISFHFKGGAKVALPLANYFSIVGDAEAVCLTIVTEGELGPAALSGGPTIILGNFQLQNYFMEFDLRNERFGFRQQTCK
ncbi:hypothetical protein RJ639_034910 [Escallonia herrerae]|uniref:Peptidase A1 domain-containing protein n=1 Tax=Escallonia herrerae TaxID=1293975 RepID=A0AA89BI87_9ASTE|nr:hypothetical protein RJ639_034910 [Escallonia herrerae]